MSIQIIIDQTEIEAAIRERIASKISFAEGQNVTIDMKAGRGDNGFTATIVIGGEEATQTGAAPSTETAKPTVSGPFKRGPKAQATPTAEVADTTAQTATQEATTETADADAGSQADAGAEAEAPASDEAPKAKGGLFAHLGQRTGTEKAE